MKTCHKCQVEKSLTEFYRDRARKDGFACRCKECMQAYWQTEEGRAVSKRADQKRVGTPQRRESNNRAVQKLRENDPLAPRRTRLKNVYGITLDDYSRMLDEQQGVCAICQQECTVYSGKEDTILCIDHDHETGEVRGLLCNACNLGLGYFHDSVKGLQRAIKYLESPRK